MTARAEIAISGLRRAAAGHSTQQFILRRDLRHEWNSADTEADAPGA
jgi:hypothetical protein